MCKRVGDNRHLGMNKMILKASRCLHDEAIGTVLQEKLSRGKTEIVYRLCYFVPMLIIYS